MQLYGSRLQYLPPEIGDCSALTHFDPYTSYGLHWFPYEITRCTDLKSSRVSTRALYGNYKNRMPFPDLRTNLIQYESEDLTCSVCGKPITYAETNQVWISLWVGTDVLPLLVNACSTTCIDALPTPPEGYLPWPHKGGKALLQPLPDEDSFRLEMEAIAARDSLRASKTVQKEKEEIEIRENPLPALPKTVESEKEPDKIKTFSLIKLVRKIWE